MYVNNTQCQAHLPDDCNTVQQTALRLKYPQSHLHFKVHSYMRNDEKPSEKLTLCTYVAQDVLQVATNICVENGCWTRRAWSITVIIYIYRVQYLFCSIFIELHYCMLLRNIHKNYIFHKHCYIMRYRSSTKTLL